MLIEQVFPFIFLGGMLAVIFYLQARRTKKANDVQGSVVVGDEVVLQSGIHGFVASVDPDVIWLEIAEGLEIKVFKSSVQAILSEPESSPIS